MIDESAGARWGHPGDEGTAGLNDRSYAGSGSSPICYAVKEALQLDAMPMNRDALVQIIDDSDRDRITSSQHNSRAWNCDAIRRRVGVALFQHESLAGRLVEPARLLLSNKRNLPTSSNLARWLRPIARRLYFDSQNETCHSLDRMVFILVRGMVSSRRLWRQPHVRRDVSDHMAVKQPVARAFGRPGQ